MKTGHQIATMFLLIAIAIAAACGGGAGDSAGNEGNATPADNTNPSQNPAETARATVTAIQPADMATKVDVASKVIVTFSKAMAQASVEDAFNLKDAANNAISGAFSWSGNSATFSPSSNLASHTTYTVTAGIGALDTSGSALEAEFISKFTTAYIFSVSGMVITIHNMGGCENHAIDAGGFGDINGRSTCRGETHEFSFTDITYLDDGTVASFKVTVDGESYSYGITSGGGKEDGECEDGDVQFCGTDGGECVSGTQTCSGGAWGVCEGELGPEVEVCDGFLDEDCDGDVDEGDVCITADLFLALDGADDHAVATGTVFPNGTEASFTAEAWFYPEGGELMVIISDDAYDIYFDNASTPQRMIFRLWRTGGSYAVTLGGAVALNTWHHVSIGYDKDAHLMHRSFDGQVGSSAADASAGFYTDNGQVFAVGDLNVDGEGVGDIFFGRIDEVRVSNSVRYTADFTPAETFGADEYTIGLWHFNEVAGSTTFSDSSGNGNTLTALGDAWTQE